MDETALVVKTYRIFDHRQNDFVDFLKGRSVSRVFLPARHHQFVSGKKGSLNQCLLFLNFEEKIVLSDFGISCETDAKFCLLKRGNQRD